MTTTIVKTISEDIKMTVQSYRKGTRTFFMVMLNDVGFGKTGYARKYDAVDYAKRCVQHYGCEKLSQMYNNHNK